jgi:very-short-patch-repair endonuclease
MEHARLHPRETLGVGTFSVAQRRAIVEQLELLRRTEPETESFFAAHPYEPFFVKNLENIQGDERDVIFISVGYARNAAGQMNMRFGPLGNQGGERRLNVLITRARRRCEVFSSITDQDINPDRASGGVAAFQLFMRFARTGNLEAAAAGPEDHAGRALEEDIAVALRERGYEVDTHVGISGAFVDVAVLSPEYPGRYLIGIECDGESYASARSARDRDRLRREALERQGWKLHRVWSMDWYQRPEEQLRRIAAAIVEEKERLASEAEDEEERVTESSIEREEHGDVLAEASVDSVAYVEATPVQPIAGCDLLGTPTQTLAVMVAEIVSVEGPIHQDEVVARVRSVWGLQRAGSRIQEHLAKTIRIARATRGVERDGKFLYIAGRKVQLRNRRNVASRGLRLPEMLPPVEIRAGIADVIRENFGAREEEIVSAVLRRLGYATSGASLREVVETGIRKMRASGEIQEQDELLTLVYAVRQA